MPCASDSFKPVKDRVDGCAAVDPDMPLRQPGQTQSVDAVENKRGKKDGGKSKEVVNLWRDISSLPLLSPDPGEWQEYAAYKNKAQCQVIGILKERIKGGAKQPRGASG